jgi:hypothetical protein
VHDTNCNVLEVFNNQTKCIDYNLQNTSLKLQQLEQTLIVITIKMLQLVVIHSQLTSFKPQLKQTINLTHATTNNLWPLTDG